MDAASWAFCSSGCKRASAPMYEDVTAVKEEAMPPSPVSSAATEHPDDFSTVVYNVGGYRFEVLRKTIMKREPKLTLLEEKLLDYEKDSIWDSSSSVGAATRVVAGPIFIDANPDRFQYILDWYRHGEIHTPAGFPRKAIIKDVEFFGLPKHKVNLNGSLLAARAKAPDGTGSMEGLPRDWEPTLEADLHEEVSIIHRWLPRDWEPTLEADLHEELDKCILDNWSTMNEYVEGLIRQMKDSLEKEASVAHEVQPDVRVKKGPFYVTLTEFGGDDGKILKWKDGGNVCSQARLNMVLSELKKRGFACQTDWKSGDMELKLGLAGTALDTHTESI